MKGWSVLKRLSRSSFLYICVLLACTDVVLSAYVPRTNQIWYEKSVNGSNEPFCRKIFEYICSQPDPHVVMMGSSLLAVPSISCDETFVRARSPYSTLPDMFAFSHYKRCDYFKMLLSQSLGKKVDVVNLGLAGIVASDQKLILEKALAFNKKPGLVVWTVAPAEFIWNDGRGVDNTRIGQAFKSYSWPFDASAIALAADRVRRECTWHFDLLENELAACKAPMSEYVNKLLNRPAQEDKALTAAKQALAANQTDTVESAMDAYGRKNRLEDIPHFKMNYSKVDNKLFDKQLESFTQTLELCNQHNVPVVIVNMPLTKYNRDLIDRNVYEKYISSVSEIAQRHRSPFVDMDSSNGFALSDFYDSTHLNETGGKKLFTALANRIPKLATDHPQLAGVRETAN
ncbi:MAG: DUF1574 domain-containing protein [Candidatus Melainabacteria bacterium]|nr:MAG: DUF1574 domain-containing protein [Candidatus Melainabacteria bacterium]